MLERKSVTDFQTRYVRRYFHQRIPIISLTKSALSVSIRVSLVKLHLFSHVFAMLLLSVGGAAAYWTKNAFGKEHLTSTHSWVAVVTSILSTLNMLGVRIVFPYFATQNSVLKGRVCCCC